MNIRTSLAVALALAVSSQAQNWVLDSTHTSIGFSIKHLAVSTVRGEFDQYAGALVGDPAKPATLKADMVIQAASVNTKVAKRDEHVRNADFLDVAKYPTIEFKGEKTEVKGKKLTMIGVLTLHGVSKRVAIPYTLNGPIEDPWKNTRIGLEGSFTIKRSDYGISTFPGVVGDELKIDIATEYTKAK